jgi:hypothetical protein
MSKIAVATIYFYRLLLFIIVSLWLSAGLVCAQATETVVKIPYMDRPASHRIYANELLKLALSLSAEKYGPFKITQQKYQTVLNRQLLEIENGQWLSVAVSMPTKEWLSNAQIVNFPIMKGLASYRLFFSLDKTLPQLNQLQSLDALKKLYIGQGRGWSTANILEDNGFTVMYGVSYENLFPMLHADRFQLLMRGIYEIEPEFEEYKHTMPHLRIVDSFAVYTYLPMYFFVNKKQIQLVERLTYGLIRANDSGQLDNLFNHYFAKTVLSLKTPRKVFFLNNSNIEPSFFVRDRPYLLEEIRQLEKQKFN